MVQSEEFQIRTPTSNCLTIWAKGEASDAFTMLSESFD